MKIHKPILLLAMLALSLALPGCSEQPFLAQGAVDWSLTSGACNNPQNPVRAVVGSGGGSAKSCRPATGQVKVCNAAYGNTGWLGIAQIWVNGNHITKGSVKVNDTYFNGPPYNIPAWHSAVMDQEMGHTFGLAHCDDPNCVMWFSNNLAETDRKGTRFCRRHQKELARSRL